MAGSVGGIDDVSLTKLRVGWLILLLGAVWPGGLIIQEIQLNILGWPFFVFWMIVMAPALAISLYGLYAKVAIKQDEGVGQDDGRG